MAKEANKRAVQTFYRRLKDAAPRRDDDDDVAEMAQPLTLSSGSPHERRNKNIKAKVEKLHVHFPEIQNTENKRLMHPDKWAQLSCWEQFILLHKKRYFVYPAPPQTDDDRFMETSLVGRSELVIYLFDHFLKKCETGGPSTAERQLLRDINTHFSHVHALTASNTTKTTFTDTMWNVSSTKILMVLLPDNMQRLRTHYDISQYDFTTLIWEPIRKACLEVVAEAAHELAASHAKRLRMQTNKIQLKLFTLSREAKASGRTDISNAIHTINNTRCLINAISKLYNRTAAKQTTLTLARSGVIRLPKAGQAAPPPSNPASVFDTPDTLAVFDEDAVEATIAAWLDA